MNKHESYSMHFIKISSLTFLLKLGEHLASKVDEKYVLVGMW